MKTKSAFLLSAVMLFAFTGCGTPAQKPFYSSVSEVTIDSIIERTKPVNMVEYKGGFKQTLKYSGFGDDNLDDSNIYLCYKKTDDIIEVNQVAEYPDDYFTRVYMSNDRNDPYAYTQSSMNAIKEDLSEESLSKLVNETVLGYQNFQAELGEVKEEDDKYVATVSICIDGENVGTDTITIDPATGLVINVVSADSTTGKDLSILSEFTYSSDIEIDTTPKTKALEQEAMQAQAEANGMQNAETEEQQNAE